MSSEFYFDPSWRVIVCQKCKTCVKPESESIIRHLRREQHGLKGEAITQQVSLLADLHPRSQAELKNTHPEPASQPVQAIPHLQILDGSRCRHCPDHLTTNTDDRHPRRHGLRLQDHATNWEKCQLQTLFAEKSLIRYFRVREASYDAVIPPLNQPVEAEAEAEVAAEAAEDNNLGAVTAAITSLHLSISSQDAEDSNPHPEGGHDAFNDILAGDDEDDNNGDGISDIDFKDDNERVKVPATADPENSEINFQISDSDDNRNDAGKADYGKGNDNEQESHSEDSAEEGFQRNTSEGNGDEITDEDSNSNESPDGRITGTRPRLVFMEEASDNESEDAFLENDEGVESGQNPVDIEKTVEEWREQAAQVLSQAWQNRCECVHDHLDEDGVVSLSDYTGRLNEICYTDVLDPRSGEHSESRRLPHPLESDHLLPCDENSSRFAWRRLLSGGDERLKLSMAKAEQECLARPDSVAVKIQRSCDVDSFLARITTLAAHRGGFNLGYYPPFMRRVTRDQQIRIQGRKVHQLKNLRLGSGVFSQGFNYDCFVFFPRMPVNGKTDTHPTDVQQAFWIDQIVLPALRESCPNHIIQHHPRSFAEAKARAQVKQEAFIQGTKQALDPRYLIPEEFLAAFWSRVIERVGTRVSDQGHEFQDLFLMVIGHNLKLVHGTLSGGQTRARFLRYIDICFQFQPEIFPVEDCWLDFGWEDTPIDTEKAITLLRKPCCLRHWANQFQSPGGLTAKLDSQFFSWCLTRDAGSARAELGLTHILREKGGMAYHKAYNLHKDVLATPLKGHTPFGPKWFEGLAFSQGSLNRWAEANRLGSSGNSGQKRKALVKAEIATKNRLFQAIVSAIKTDFGVRQEYRINIELFRSLDLNDDILIDTISGPLEAGRHRPYWILMTENVHQFIWIEIKRWLLPVEFLASRAERGSSDALQSGNTQSGQELVDSVIMAALIRSLRFCLAEDDPTKKHELWRDTYPARYQVQDESKARGFRWEDTGTTRRGLNYQQSLEMYGVAWVPDDLIHWDSLTFKPEFYKVVAFRQNGVASSFRKAAHVQRVIERDELILSRLKERLIPLPAEQESARWNDGHHLCEGLRLVSELIIQAYILDVCMQLRPRFHGDTAAVERMESMAEQGFSGLSYNIVAKMLGIEPHIILSRESGGRGQARYGKAQFRAYNEGGWSDKLQGLFEWNDEQDDRKRGWHNKRFRVLARRYYGLILEVRGQVVAERFQEGLGLEAAKHLWIVPQYDKDHLAVMRKKSAYNRIQTREYLDGLSELERTNWIAATFEFGSAAATALDQVRAHERDLRCRRERGPDHLTAEQMESHYGRIKGALRRHELEVLKQDGRVDSRLPTWERVPDMMAGLHWTLKLNRAKEFMDEIETEIQGTNWVEEVGTAEREGRHR